MRLMLKRLLRSAGAAALSWLCDSALAFRFGCKFDWPVSFTPVNKVNASVSAPTSASRLEILNLRFALSLIMVSAAMSGPDMFSVVVKYNTINFDGKLFFTGSTGIHSPGDQQVTLKFRQSNINILTIQ